MLPHLDVTSGAPTAFPNTAESPDVPRMLARGAFTATQVQMVRDLKFGAITVPLICTRSCD
jgi:hypothetical protein